MTVSIDYTGGAFAANKAQKVGTITGSDVDASTGNYFAYTPTADTTFTFSNAPASGTATGFALAVTGVDVVAGYDIANASYDTVSFSVAAQEANPAGLTFSASGDKLYIIGNVGDDVNEYDLSTAWDVSTAVFLQLFSVAAQDNLPSTVLFGDSGLSMFVLGSQNDSVYRYTLTTAYDISTASYLSTFSVATQDTAPSGLFFKPDGTKMYVTGQLGTQSIYEYSLSAAWDITTSSFTQSFSVASQEANPKSIFFTPSGDRFFMSGVTTNDAVYEYSLSTSWDISSASYVRLFSVATQETAPSGLSFKSDGTKMYVVGVGTDTVYQYTTGTATPATLTYPTAVDWPSGTAPDAPAAGETDVLAFYTDDGGTNWYGFQAGDAMA